jgi:hypothetical protein
MVTAVDQETGDEAWSITCEDIVDEAGTACLDLIEAESSLAPSELVFYYSDAFGNVKALGLGEGSFNTTAPTPFPTTTPYPTSTPTIRVTTSPTVSLSESPSQVPTETPTISPGPTLANFSMYPSAIPTLTSSAAPTVVPTISSTEAPSSSPTVSPSAAPTSLPIETPAPVSPAPVEGDTPAPEPTLSPGDIGSSCSHGVLSAIVAFLTIAVAISV